MSLYAVIYEIYYVWLKNVDILTLRFYIILFPSVFLYWLFPCNRKRILKFLGIFIYVFNGFMSFPIIIYITLVSWFSVLILSRQSISNRYCFVIRCIGIVLLMIPLVFLRMIASSYCQLLNRVNHEWLSVIGVSYVTLMAISYIIDYDKKRCDKQNLKTVFLYLSFFPLAICGPIERPQRMFEQFNGLERKSFDYDDFLVGIIMIVYGLFAKLVVADRFSIVTNELFGNYRNYLGYELLFAIFLYGIQLYIDFMACTTIVRGLGTLFGISLSENFKQPYLSESVLEFWNRWHISLSNWLKDYVYIPLGGNKNGKFRQCINIMITFIVSGLWHGFALHYVMWGVLHGLYQIFIRILPKTNDKTIGRKVCNISITFILVNFAWLFFREGIHRSVEILKRIIFGLDISFFNTDSYLNLGLSLQNWNIAVIGCVIICIVDFLKIKYRNTVKIQLKNESVSFRFLIIIFFFVVTLLFGQYGYQAGSSSFIYRGF